MLRGRFTISIEYTAGDYDYDYDGECFYDDDDDEVEWSELSTSARDIVKKAKILEDEKKKSGMTGTSLDTQPNFHHPSCDEEKTNMDIEDGASEENISTERKKKEKRKSQEDRAESEQNDGNEIAIEVKKKKDSISKSDV
ncbi:uncharacterized protein LOC113283501 [Papaver somniferum]|uniref:uncharacterized protein LOC113283501 n=1 Tax=Papaver somniferum TaxID=3469 RepID=UPI000E6FA7A4|nr:uncharacterized protein LOC113283501 [Papaver somniferum]